MQRRYRLACALLALAFCLALMPGDAARATQDGGPGPKAGDKQPSAAKAATVSLTCKYVRATYAHKLLTELFAQPSAKVRPAALVVDMRLNALLVHGTPDQVAQAKEMLSRIDAAAPGQQPRVGGAPVLKSFAVPSGKADAVAAALQKLYRDEPDVRIVSSGGILIVLADPETLMDIVRYLEEVATPVKTEQGGNVRVITLESGSAADLARAIADMFKGMLPNPVRVFIPGEPGAAPKPPAQGKGKPAVNPAATGQPQEKPLPAVTITAFGNRMIVTSDDPRALVLVQEMARLFQMGGCGEHVVLPLRHAKAADAARVLDEVFNGKPGAGRRVERVRIVADPTTNALIVQATPLDLLTIRRLLEKSIDGIGEEGEPVKTWAIGPLKKAKAVEVSRILSEIYRGSKDRPSSVAITVDDCSNSVLLRCTRPVFEEVKRLVDHLEELAGQGAAKVDADRPMRVYRLEAGSATDLAERMAEMLKELVENPIKVFSPKEASPSPKPDKGDPAPKQGAGKVLPPLTITVDGMRITVTSDDPRALGLACELFHLLQGCGQRESDYRLIRLQYAKAIDVAKLLDEVFNGLRPVESTFTYAFRIAREQAAESRGGAPARKARIRVIADPSNNSLLLRASDADAELIRRLLRSALDVPPEPNELLSRTWYFGPLKHVKAEELATILRALYPGSKERGEMIAVGADERNNALAVACPRDFVPGITALVERLDRPRTQPQRRKK